MVYIKGSKKLLEAIKEHQITNIPMEAKLAVVEMPGDLPNLEQLQNIPVIFVVTGMVNLNEWRLINNYQTATLQTIPGIIQHYLDALSIEENEDECEITYNEPIDDQPEYIKQPSGQPAQVHYNAPAPGLANQHEIFSQQSTRGMIAAFFSASGGVGKTFTSINIAGAAALNGINTIAVDLDFGYGDMDTAVGLVEPTQRDKVIDRKARVPKTGWATVPKWRRYAPNLETNLLRHNSELSVLPCYPYAGSEIPSTEIEDLIVTLAEKFDMVAIDLGVDAFSPHASTALRLADKVFLIGSQDEKTIGKLTQYLCSDYAQKEKTELIINMVKATGYYSPKEISVKLGFGEFNEIPLDHQGVNAAQKAHKLTVQLRGSAAGDAVKAIASKHLPFEIDYDQGLAKKTLLSSIKQVFRRG